MKRNDRLKKEEDEKVEKILQYFDAYLESPQTPSETLLFLHFSTTCAYIKGTAS